jgi:acetylornithine deacetylase/succinyl-diaminopimelate desuccinylase-like protein
MHPDDNPFENNVHGTDESVSIRTLVTSTKVMLALAYDMLAAK